MTKDVHDGPRRGMTGEVIGTFVVFGGICVLLLNLVDAYGFLTYSSPEPKHVLTYRIVALLMVGAVVWAFVSARRRRARVIAYIWQTLVAIVSIIALVVFVVPTIDWRSLNDPPPVEEVENGVIYDPCYSGGDPCG